MEHTPCILATDRFPRFGNNSNPSLKWADHGIVAAGVNNNKNMGIKSWGLILMSTDLFPGLLDFLISYLR